MAPRTTRSESAKLGAFWLKRAPLHLSRGKGHGSDEALDPVANIPRNTAEMWNHTMTTEKIRSILWKIPDCPGIFTR